MKNIAQSILKFYAIRHNQIQFFGYEAANIALFTVQFSGGRGWEQGLNAESSAAAAFMVGSLFVFFFHPQKRPWYLFLGGAGIFLGGLFLFLGEYYSTGVAVILSGAEMMRGALNIYEAAVLTRGLFYKTVFFFIAPYRMFMKSLFRKFRTLGQFVDEHPFITGAILRAPTRIEFTVKQFLMGGIVGWVGVAVGLSWMILGDIAIAFNDKKLQKWALSVASQ